MEREIFLPALPLRIVSLVPSQTELLHYLDLEDEVVGITKFCIHPKSWHEKKTRVGGTKALDISKIKSLQPDLIIGNKEENNQQDIEKLEKIAPVWMSDIYNLDDAFEMILSLGKILGKKQKAQKLVEMIQNQFDKLKPKSASKTALYFIWNNPEMLAGKHTFINEMMNRCGLINLAQGDRYPIASGEEKPDFILLSSEPFPFNETHVVTFQQKYPESKVICVDGEYFSWYGSRLKDAPTYFNEMLAKF